MKSLFILCALFALALFVGSVKARKHPEEYVKQVEEQALAAELIKVEGRLADIILSKQDKFTSNTKPRRDNSIWAYSSDDDAILSKQDKFMSNTKSRRDNSIWAYSSDDDAIANQREEKPLVKELQKDASGFWVYSGDDHVKRPN